MYILTLILLWPLIFFTTGLVFVAFLNLFKGGFAFSSFLILLIIIHSFFQEKKLKESPKELSALEQLESTRRTLLIFSTSLLFPIFIRYLIESFDKSLIVVILGLIIGFTLLVWGMFINHNQVIMYSNIIGGVLAITYLYSQLWALGELARIIATGFGLTVAVAVSIVKLKDKLT